MIRLGWIQLLIVGCLLGMVCGEDTVTKLSQKAVWGYEEVTTASNFLKFDEDMYLSEDLFCMPEFNIPANATCLPCSYSGETCPSNVEPTQFDHDIMLQLIGLPPCPCDRAACGLEPLIDDTTAAVKVSQTSSKIFRYEHISWDQGFVIKKRSITDFSPTIVVSTDLGFGLDKIVAESTLDHILVCPSHPLFGQKENTITYYIFIQSNQDTGLEITIETLETDTSVSTPIDYRPFPPNIPFLFWMFIFTPLELGANLRLPGNYFVDTFMRPPRDVYPRALLYPFTECALYSIRFEITKYDGGGLLSPFIYTGVLTEAETETIGTRPGVAPCDTCFKAEQFLGLDSQLLKLSSDTVLGFCPRELNATNYIVVFINAPDGDWEINVHVRLAENSQYLESFPISDPRYSHVQIQERLASSLILQFPCDEGETCGTFSAGSQGYLEFASRRNLVTPDYFPSLLYPLPGEPAAEQDEDLVELLSFETLDGYSFRCLDRERDSACGLLSIYPFGDFASPLLYPALQPIRSLDPLPSLVAEDLSELFPRRADRLSLVTFLAVSDIPIISEDRFEGGKLLFANPNPLHTKDYVVLPQRSYNISEMEEEPPSVCSYKTFHPLYEFMTALHEVLQLSQDGETNFDIGNKHLKIDARTANFWSYVMLWTREWQSCWDNAAALVQFGTRVTPRDNSTLCASNDPSDPCCNPRLEWSECCSAEGRDVLQKQWLPLSADTTNLNTNCFDPDCMETFAEDYREIYQSGIGEKICVVNDEITSNNSAIFDDCISRFIGEEPSFGIDCENDGDCDYLGDPNGYCDLYSKQCVVDLTIQENAFLNCLVDQMDSITKSLVYEELVKEGIADPKNPASGDVFLTADLLREYSEDGEYRCFSDYGPLYNRHSYFTLRTLPTTRESTCPVCDEQFLDTHCLARSCDIPVQCYDASSTCVTNFILVEPECDAPADDDFVCNWDNTLTEEECENGGDSGCMFCFNNSYCVGLPGGDRGTEEECEDRRACVLNDGDLVWDVTEEECEELNRCSSGMGTNEAECGANGYCDDPDDIEVAIAALIIDFPEIVNATKGVCVTPLNPDNTPSCPRLRPTDVETLDFTSQRGCIRIAQCGFIRSDTRTICTHDPQNEEECISNFNGTWLTLPIQSKQACENPLNVDSDDYPGYCRLTGVDRYLSPRNKSDCEECGGLPEPPATWMAPTWRGGQYVRPQWRRTEMVPKYHYVDDSISYLRLQNLFDIAASNYENFILSTGESCLINPFLNYLDIVACDCADGGPPEHDLEIENPFIDYDLTSAECRNSLDDDEIGTLWFCSDLDLQIGVISGVVGSLSEYVSGDLCFYSDIILAPTSDFVGNRPSEPITVTNDPNELDPSPVRNQVGASVGEILGDGVGLLLSENVQPIDWSKDAGAISLRFSVDISVFENLDIPSNYILDFGLEVVDPDLKTQPDDEIEVQPTGSSMGLTVGRPVSEFLRMSEEDNQLPIVIDGILLDPFRYNKVARIYPIARLPDWEDEDKDEALDSGETAMIGIFTGLYGIAFLVTLFFLIKGLHALTLSLLILFIYVLATFAFRTVFWAIVASGGYEETSSGYYILIEPPSFFIVSVLTVLIMSFAFIVAASQGKNKLGTYWMYWLILQLFLIAVLFVVVGLMIGLDNNDEITISCFGRQSSVEENTTIRDIRIAYHSFLLFVAIVGAIIVMKQGRDLPDHENKTTLQTLSALAGVAVVLTSLLWVIYSAIDDPSPYFVIPLFFTEVPPLLLMCHLTFPSKNNGMEAEMDL